MDLRLAIGFLWFQTHDSGPPDQKAKMDAFGGLISVGRDVAMFTL